MSFVGLSYNFFFVGELYVLINISATVTDNLLGQNQKAEEKEKKNRYIISLFFLNNPNWLSSKWKLQFNTRKLTYPVFLKSCIWSGI